MLLFSPSGRQKGMVTNGAENWLGGLRRHTRHTVAAVRPDASLECPRDRNQLREHLFPWDLSALVPLRYEMSNTSSIPRRPIMFRPEDEPPFDFSPINELLGSGTNDAAWDLPVVLTTEAHPLPLIDWSLKSCPVLSPDIYADQVR